MIYTFYMIILISFLTLMIILLISFISKKSIVDNQKTTPFECGFCPMSYSRIPFSIHFFLIAVIFLIFDIEIILVLPMILTLKSSLTTNWMITSILFTLILIFGLIHEWKNGMISWAN